ncbi:LiaF transmembrane domain-containing protein [Actinomadura chokoriensis]|uniref:LiaF-related protein n=1 Tax=Actinomadura chokoriensis TaxID=454156 RepID=A0ABV4QYT6_9ACTN
MTRTRVLLGLVAVAVGAALAAGGSDALRRGGEVLTEIAPFLLVAVGAIILLRSVLPRDRTVVGPALLVVAGLAWLAVNRDWFGSEAMRPFASAVLVAGGVAVAMSSGRRDLNIDTGVRRCMAVVLPRVSRIAQVPRKLIVRALAGDVVIDLSQARLPRQREIEIDLALLYGHVEILVPDDWAVVHGRLETARWIRLNGRLDPPYAYSPPPASDEDEPDWHGGRGGVVLNISGIGGSVVLVRTSSE